MKKFIAASLMLALMLIGSFSVGNENVEVVAQGDDYWDRVMGLFPGQTPTPASTYGPCARTGICDSSMDIVVEG